MPESGYDQSVRTQFQEMVDISQQSSNLLDFVSERDLDLALLSGFYTSEEFRSFILEEVIGWTGEHKLIQTRVSETSDSRETDVLLVVDLVGCDRVALMIEDKIAAAFQPGQAAGYRQRGDQGITDGRWARFATCLCAPESYLRGARSANEWDAYVSLERISTWAPSSSDGHHSFVAAIASQAIAKREAGVLPKSPEATAFWRAYRLLATELLPYVNISRLPTEASVAPPWPRFYEALLPLRFLEHKPREGRVDLTVDRFSVEALSRCLKTVLPFEIVVVKAGRSAALRIAVPRVDHLRPFDEQEEEVLSALAAVERLLAIAEELAFTDPMS